jgi:RES domain-containing protein
VTQVFRICSSKYSEFDGIGSSLHPGRWNLTGEKVIYSAGSRAMAILEALAHLGDVKPVDYVIRAAAIPETVAITYPQDHPAKLDGFKWALSDVQVSKRIGSQWLHQAETAVLAVPSVLVPDEYNFLINPAHPGFARIQLGACEPYQFDDRLWRAAGGQFPQQR